METNKYTNIRVHKEDAELLKIVASLSRESMLASFHRLVKQEHERLVYTQGFAAVQAGGVDATQATE
jgi:hypothetical protein